MNSERKDIAAARERVCKLAYETPLVEETALSERFGGQVLSKLENLQNTGSFKIRGAANKVLSMDPAKTRGIVAFSAGNHARGVARAARAADIPATLVMPRFAPISKSAAAQREGGENVRIVLHGDSFDEAMEYALAMAEDAGMTVVHPYDDPAVIAGQGTIGLEILERIGAPGSIYVPVGGGGLFAGIAAAVKEAHPSVDMIAVQAKGAASLKESLAAGRPLPGPGGFTIADGIAVKSLSDRTFEAARRYADDVAVVDDEEIAAAMLFAIEEMKTTLEGAGAAALAAMLFRRPPKQFPAVMIHSGGNIDVNFLAQIVERGLFRSGRLLRLRFLVQDRPGSLAGLLTAVARERSSVVSIEHDRLPADCPPGFSVVVLMLETRDRAHGDDLVARLAQQGYASS
jgi:threonine dehydratase